MFYRQISTHFTNLHFMDILSLYPSNYSLAIELFIRLLGLLYLCVYIPFLFQIRGLYGKEGILPITDFLNAIKNRHGRKSYHLVPTLFWINSSDTALLVFVWSGIALATLLLFGVMPAVMLLLLFILHLSLASAGQEFMSFGWETLLIEITFTALLLVATAPYNTIAWIALNFLLMRFMIQAGASKLRAGDKNWRNLTALSYHYLSQPIPNAVAWYMDKLPMWFHKISTVAMFWVELAVPLLIFNIPEVRLFAFANFFGLLMIIWISGNFSYLNHMTAVFCVILISNRFLEPFMGAPVVVEPSYFIWDLLISIISGGVLFLEVINLWNYFFPNSTFQKLLVFWYPYHICHPHQLFSVMTTDRNEVVIEGSDDGKEWKEYLFWFKPSEISRRPRRISPFQPRIDWQAWFLPFRPYGYQNWFHRLLQQLLLGSKSVEKLFRHNPFPDHPPRYLRSLFYRYTFTTFEERKATGNWWKRQLLGQYSSPVELKKNAEPVNKPVNVGVNKGGSINIIVTPKDPNKK